MTLRERTHPGLGIIEACLGLLLLLTGWLSAENFSALAQNSDATSADNQSTKEAQTAEQFAEAQRLLKGPAGNPECVWLGRRVVNLLWRDDMDTAFRHLDLYDRFGCPGGHIQAALRCLVLNGNIDPKDAESLNGRVHANRQAAQRVSAALTARRPAVSLGALSALGEGQEPERARR